MLVLVSFALVLVATVLLVLGLMSDDGLTLIYISIACSALAGLVLLVAVRLSRPKVTTAAEGPAPLSEPEPEPEPAAVAASTLAAAPAVAPPPAAPVVAAPVPDTETVETVVAEEDWDGEFPIAEYDDLKVSEIMPLLPELYPEELDVVEERERTTKNRGTIISRIHELREGADVDDDTDEQVVEAPVGADSEWAAADSDDDEWEEDGDLPISGYDTLTVSAIKPRLAELSDDELAIVRAHEAGGANRATVLKEIDRLSGDGTGAATTTPTKAGPAKKAAAAKKGTAAKKATAAKKTASKKAAATKTTPRKTASKKAAATKTAARKTAATKTAARKTAAAKTASKKAAAAKTAARKTATKKTATKKAAAKKTTAKKATRPTKKR